MAKTHVRNASVLTASTFAPSERSDRSTPAHSRTPSAEEGQHGQQDTVILVDKDAFRHQISFPFPLKRYKSAAACSKWLEKGRTRAQRTILVVKDKELPALLPLVQAPNSTASIIAYGNAKRYKSSKVYPVESLQVALDRAESLLSERVFLAPESRDSRTMPDVPDLLWIDDACTSNPPRCFNSASR